jgi:hypothetical protein
MEKLEGIRLKTKRARNQIKGLKAEIDAFIDRKPYIPRVKFDPKAHLLIASAHVNKPPDPMWGVQIGEIIHNLRSALDHLVWELAFPKSMEVTKNQFPIFMNESGFRKRASDGEFLKGVSTKAIRIIKSEQPFPKVDGGTGEGTKSPLWHLHELSNADKHRILHVTGTLIDSFNFTFPPLKHDVTGVKRLNRCEPGPIQQDTVLGVAYFPGVTKWPFTESKVQCELRMGIAFDNGTPSVGGWFVFQTLVDVADRTERIIERIAAEVFETDF